MCRFLLSANGTEEEEHEGRPDGSENGPDPDDPNRQLVPSGIKSMA